MEKFIEEINNFTNNKYEFMLKSALLDKDADFCVVEILYKDGIIFSQIDKKEIEEFAISILPNKYVYEFNFIKRYINEERIFEDTKAYLAKNFPSISNEIKKVTFENRKFDIFVVVDELSFNHAKDRRVAGEIENYLKQTNKPAKIIEVSK